jgi:predicted  nucleic acid-binding Zn-ribbon protein
MKGRQFIKCSSNLATIEGIADIKDMKSFVDTLTVNIEEIKQSLIETRERTEEMVKEAADNNGRLEILEEKSKDIGKKLDKEIYDFQRETMRFRIGHLDAQIKEMSNFIDLLV